MPLYLYCLTSPAAEPPPALHGVDEAPVRGVDAGVARAWVSELAGAPAPTVERARAHDAVVREAMRAETPLPARFGQLFASEDALRQALSSRGGEIAAALDRVAGMVEMTLRVRLTRRTPEKLLPGKELTGRGYLRSLGEREHLESAVREEAEFLQARVARAVSGVARAEAATGMAAGERTLVVSHLVPRAEVPRYRKVLRDAMGGDPRHPIMISGPWAPYGFAELTNE